MPIMQEGRDKRMPFLFLSPSTQYFNPYVTTGDERYWMNALADEMMPYLHASGITVTRNDPDGSAAQSIRDSNASRQDFHLALHSNASGDGSTEGRQRGIIAFYYPTSANGRRAANIFVENLKEIYPLPSLVTARATTALGEVRQPKPPSVLLEIGYHDNTADAVWIQDNVQNIAENLSRSLAEYFALPFIYPMTPRTGTVVTERDALNVRAYPSMSGQVVGSVPHEAQLTVYGQTDGWYSMGYGNLAGYVRSEYVRL